MSRDVWVHGATDKALGDEEKALMEGKDDDFGQARLKIYSICVKKFCSPPNRPIKDAGIGNNDLES